jgi:hypothetical protein
VGLALRTSGGGNEYVVSSPFLQYSIMGKPCIVSHRKVFDDMMYEYQFYNEYDLAKLINLALKKPYIGEINKDYVLNNHHAKAIADKIWSRLSY